VNCGVPDSCHADGGGAGRPLSGPDLPAFTRSREAVDLALGWLHLMMDHNAGLHTNCTPFLIAEDATAEQVFVDLGTGT
jgi:hypothetical protein